MKKLLAIITLFCLLAGPLTAFARDPLHWAVEQGKIDIVKTLIASGADVNSPERYEIRSSDYLGNGDDVSNLSHSRALMPPLYVAISTNNLEMVKLLIASGADVNYEPSSSKESFASTRLLCSAIIKSYLTGFSRIDIIKLLVASGADVNSCGGINRRPLELALGLDQTDIFKLLLSKGAR